MRKYINKCVDCENPTSAIRCKKCANIESAKRRSEAIKATWTEEKSRVRSLQMMGNQNGIGNLGMTGKKHSEEWKMATSVRMKNRPTTEKMRQTSRDRCGEKHGAWKGGRIVDGHGYIKVRVGNKYKFEHRVIMERVLGREMLQKEQVHHKNGNRQDNRPENLEFRNGHHGIGATVHCPTCTCSGNKQTITTEYLKDFNFN